MPINHNGHIATCVANAHAHRLRHTHVHIHVHIPTHSCRHSITLYENCCIPCGVMEFTVHVSPLFPLLFLFLSLSHPISFVLLYHFVSLCVALLSMSANDSVSRVFQFFATFARREKSFRPKCWEKFLRLRLCQTAEKSQENQQLRFPLLGHGERVFSSGKFRLIIAIIYCHSKAKPENSATNCWAH